MKTCSECCKLCEDDGGEHQGAVVLRKNSFMCWRCIARREENVAFEALPPDATIMVNGQKAKKGQVVRNREKVLRKNFANGKTGNFLAKKYGS